MMKALAGVVALVIHGGGFTQSTPNMRFEVQALRAQGLRAVAVDYPLGNPYRAELSVFRQAARWRRRGYRVVAYGVSAGGCLAIDLALGGYARAAVAVAPETNLVTWPWPNKPWPVLDAARASPLLHYRGQSTPILLIHAVDDGITPYWQSTQFVAIDRHARLVTLKTGNHLIIAERFPFADRWLLSRARK